MVAQRLSTQETLGASRWAPERFAAEAAGERATDSRWWAAYAIASLVELERWW